MSRGRGLIVEDVASTRRLMKVALASSGLVMDEASDVAGATMALDKGGYDVVLLDLGLGQGRSGIDLLRDIRKRPELDGMPVLLVSGSGDELATMREAFKEGADDVLAKPVVPEHLAERVAAARASRRGRAKRRSTTPNLRRVAPVRAPVVPSLPHIEANVAVAGVTLGNAQLLADTIDVVTDEQGRLSAILVSPTERGVGGALIAAVTRASLRASLTAGVSLAAAMTVLDRTLPAGGMGSVGVSIVRASSMRTRVELVNAGLPSTLIHRPGERARRFVSSPPAGLTDDIAHCVAVVDVPQGTVITLRSRAHGQEAAELDFLNALVERHGAHLATASAQQLEALLGEIYRERGDAAILMMGFPAARGGHDEDLEPSA